MTESFVVNIVEHYTSKQTTTSSASFYLYGAFLGCKTCELEKLLGII